MCLSWNSPEMGIFDLNTLKVKSIIKLKEGANHMNIKENDENLIGAALDHKDVQIIDKRKGEVVMDLQEHHGDNFAI